jgi:hypothetical protein
MKNSESCDAITDDVFVKYLMFRGTKMCSRLLCSVSRILGVSFFFSAFTCKAFHEHDLENNGHVLRLSQQKAPSVIT